MPKGADPSKQPQFSAVAVLSGNEPVYDQFVAAVWEELDRACVEKHGATVKEMRERGKFKLAVKRNNDPEVGKQAMAGFKERPQGIHFGATTQFMPPAMDQNMMGMSKDRADELYDGIYGQLGVTAWGWTHPTGGKGLSFNLHGIIKRFDGERLGGAQADMSKAADDGYVPEGAKTIDNADTGGGGYDGGSQDPAGTPGGAGAGGDQYGF